MPLHHPRAGQPAKPSDLIDLAALERAYYTLLPDADNPAQRVAFGTSGHRGSPFNTTFNETHILAITQALCEYRQAQGTTGPLFIGRDSHAASVPALRSALEVLAAHGIDTMIDSADGHTPTPAISHAILNYNRGRRDSLADGVVVTPSHNPPQDGGFKYNTPNGGPADIDATKAIETRANELITNGLDGIKRMPYERARAASCIHLHDYIAAYVNELEAVIDVDVLRGSKLRIAVDPLGGAGVDYWQPIAERLDINLDILNDKIDMQFGFMTLDWDGQIRMDCSSPYAMASLLAHKDEYQLAFGNDPDSDRHGIVTPKGLMNPNHYLAVAIDYLFQHRPNWKKDAGVGKTIVSSSMIDHVAEALHRPLVEVPVGFKWFVSGLHEGSLGFGGEESAGASFLRHDGRAWSTDKDGLIMNLLAVEILARTGADPAQHYQRLTEKFGAPVYARLDAPASRAQKAVLSKLNATDITSSTLAGDTITSVQTHASGNGAAIGGVKVNTAQGWFAARPSGTEDVYKLYAESFRGPEHLLQLQEEAQTLVTLAFNKAGL
jgi:phosphoglucomutase